MFECIKTGAQLRLWNGQFVAADAFDLGRCYLFQCMVPTNRPYKDRVHFDLHTCEKHYMLDIEFEGSVSIIIVSKADCLNFGYDGTPVTTMEAK